MNPQDPSPLDLSQPEPTTVQISTDPKQQVLDRLKGSVNVLLTVGPNPSVDQLTAAIGFTLVLNKLKKHGTTVFSGDTPPAIDFLEPNKTIQKNIDSLRDFIIALDKSKADKLRYKVEDRFVKIFITPYHTNISENDLEFGQGDFNVDVIMALGVARREDLDGAIKAHGRILHDATVISITKQSSDDIGAINWHVPEASSFSEILVDLSDSLKSPETELFDEQIATAFLTGIVSETERFSNDKTTPQTMSLAGILMKAGANQQLIAANLQSPGTKPETTNSQPATLAPTEPVQYSQPAPVPQPVAAPDPEPIVAPVKPVEPTPEPAPTPPPTVTAVAPPAPQVVSTKPADGSLAIAHEESSHISLDMPDSPPEPKEAPIDNIDIDKEGILHKFGENPNPSMAVDPIKAKPEFIFQPMTKPEVDHDDQTLEEIEKAINSPHLKENGGDTVLSPEHGGQPTTPLAALNATPIDLDLGHGQPGLTLPNPFAKPEVAGNSPISTAKPIISPFTLSTPPAVPFMPPPPTSSPVPPTPLSPPLPPPPTTPPPLTPPPMMPPMSPPTP